MASVTTLLGKRPVRTVHERLPGSVIVAGVLLWIVVVLGIDAHGSLTTQHVLGLVSWGLLALALCVEPAQVRWQVLVVVAFATIVEYTASPLLHIYVYRLHNVPAFVPPGHGLVYLAALSFGRIGWVQDRIDLLTVAVVAIGGGWATYGLLFADRRDVLGAFWFACLLGFLRWGPSRALYLGAFVVVSTLELVGTSLGNWAWQTHDPTGIVAMGNPPSGAAGGYGWFDLAALLLGPLGARAWARWWTRHRSREGSREGLREGSAQSSSRTSA